jgi:quinol monooxygenase YgiN
MGIFVITAFRPKPGKEADLLRLTRDHMPVLRAQGLITDRPCHAMLAKDGTVIEVFEWKSQEAINAAHTNPEVIKLWKRYEAACDYITLDQIPESHEMFPGFEPIEL